MSELFGHKVTMRKVEHPTQPGEAGDKALRDFIKRKLDEQLLERAKEIGCRNRMKR